MFSLRMRAHRRTPHGPTEPGGATQPGTGAWLLFAATAFCVLAVYVATLWPSTPGGDSGELIAAAYTGGVPHPPGYPLFAMLARLFTVLPFGSIAWRVNLFTAASGAAAAGVLAVAVARWSGAAWAGVAAAGLFAFSPGVWEHAVGAEVFALNNLFTAVLLLAAVQYNRTRHEGWVLAGAAAFGLGLANHHTIVFLGAPLAVTLIWLEPRRWLRGAALARLGACFAAGLLPYLYLPLAAISPAEVTWGDQRTLQGFLTHLLRSEYGTLRLGSDAYTRDVSLAGQLAMFGSYQVRALAFVGVPLAAVGLVRGWMIRADRPLIAWTAAAFALYVVVFHHLANLPVGDALFLAVLERFWQMPTLLLSAWAGLGLAAAAPLLTRVAAARIVTWAVALALAAVPAAVHFRAQDRRAAHEFLDYGTWLLTALPDSALLLARGDLIVNTVHHAQAVAGVRRDVRVLDLERLTYPWMARVVRAHLPDVALPATVLAPAHVDAPDGFTLADLVRANAPARRVFVAGNLTPGEDAALGDHDRWPVGLGVELVPQRLGRDTAAWLAESDAGLPRFTLPAERHRRAGSWSDVVWQDFWEAHHRRGVKMLELGLARGDREWTERAAELLAGIVAANPQVTPLLYRNLGLAYATLRPHGAQYDALMRSAWERYLATGDPADPAMPAIREALGQRR
jgi:hypothetical protein